jgi:hypothetical protein
MEFTFGIITDGNVDDRLHQIIDSIEANCVPTYEIIVVGNSGVCRDRTRVIPFDDSQKPGCWITRKKNIIVDEAAYENVVLLHDYIALDTDWYNGFVRFGENYDWCVSPIVNQDGSRFRDFTLFGYTYRFGETTIGNVEELDPYFLSHCLLPYTFRSTPAINQYLYISGSYYIIKRTLARENPLNEKLLACQGEDLDLTSRLHQKGILIKCNPYSRVRFLKQKEPTDWEHPIDEEHLAILVEKSGNLRSSAERPVPLETP